MAHHPHPGTHAKKSALFSHRRRSRRERGQDRPVVTHRRRRHPSPGHAYHGRTLLTMTMTAKNVPRRDGFGPSPGDLSRPPYPFRWPTGPDHCAMRPQCPGGPSPSNRSAPTTPLPSSSSRSRGEAASSFPPAAYLQGVAAPAREHGIVLIADEVRDRIARTGAMFASEHDGIIPTSSSPPARPRRRPALPLASPAVPTSAWTPSLRAGSAAPSPATRWPAPRPSGSETIEEQNLSPAPARSRRSRGRRWRRRHTAMRGRGCADAARCSPSSSSCQHQRPGT